MIPLMFTHMYTSVVLDLDFNKFPLFKLSANKKR